MQRTIHNLLAGTLAVSIAGATALWSSAGIGADSSGNRAGDASMTCAQIAQELQPYMQRMSPSITALGQTAQEVQTKGETRVSKAMPEWEAESAAARAAAMDPTGLSSKLLGQAQVRRQEERWKRAQAEDKPLNDQYKAQTEQVAKQGMQMQSDARLQRLLQLAQEKNCH